MGSTDEFEKWGEIVKGRAPHSSTRGMRDARARREAAVPLAKMAHSTHNLVRLRWARQAKATGKRMPHASNAW